MSASKKYRPKTPRKRLSSADTRPSTTTRRRLGSEEVAETRIRRYRLMLEALPFAMGRLLSSCVVEDDFRCYFRRCAAPSYRVLYSLAMTVFADDAEARSIAWKHAASVMCDNGELGGTVMLKIPDWADDPAENAHKRVDALSQFRFGKECCIEFEIDYDAEDGDPRCASDYDSEDYDDPGRQADKYLCPKKFPFVRFVRTLAGRGASCFGFGNLSRRWHDDGTGRDLPPADASIVVIDTCSVHGEMLLTAFGKIECLDFMATSLRRDCTPSHERYYSELTTALQQHSVKELAFQPEQPRKTVTASVFLRHVSTHIDSWRCLNVLIVSDFVSFLLLPEEPVYPLVAVDAKRRITCQLQIKRISGLDRDYDIRKRAILHLLSPFFVIRGFIEWS